MTGEGGKERADTSKRRAYSAPIALTSPVFRSVMGHMRPEDNRSPFGAGPLPPDPEVMKEATVWFIREAAAGFSQADRRRLDEWCAQSPAHARAYQRVRALWHAPELQRAAFERMPRGAVDAARRSAGLVWRRGSMEIGRAHV